MVNADRLGVPIVWDRYAFLHTERQINAKFTLVKFSYRAALAFDKLTRKNPLNALSARKTRSVKIINDRLRAERLWELYEKGCGNNGVGQRFAYCRKGH